MLRVLAGIGAAIPILALLTVLAREITRDRAWADATLAFVLGLLIMCILLSVIVLGVYALTGHL